MGHILKIKPVFKEMIWGGHKLRDVYGYDIPSDHTGECWAISAHKNGDCTIENSEFAGKTLSWLLKITENCSAISKEMNSRCW